MRRSIAAAVGTVAGLAALLGYKSGTPPVRTTGVAATSSGGGAATDTPSTAPATSPTTAPSANKTVDGALITTRFGDVQVEAVLSGSRLVDVSTLTLPTDRPRSAQISSIAAPILRREALAAQGASINTVSGATYTSDAYARSLQAAIDAARQS
jgi:uncharacterized protein with FMN-binding domain